jgi:3D (Asp-Asp-Asp) domain-containing protein
MSTLGSVAIVLTEIAVAAPLVLAGARTPAPPRAGETIRVTATAYCQDGRTKSGAATRAGIVAADPQVLPVGSVIRVESPGAYAGIYTVMDTGGSVDGRMIDIFMPDCARAKKFGRQTLRIRILRRGWDPKASAGDR